MYCVSWRCTVWVGGVLCELEMYCVSWRCTVWVGGVLCEYKCAYACVRACVHVCMCLCDVLMYCRQSNQGPTGPKLVDYFHTSRNFIRLTDPGVCVCVHTYVGVWMCVVCFHSLCCLPCSAVKRNNLVHCGRADIVRALRGLPRTSHIMSSFTVDVLVATVREHPRTRLCESHLKWSGGVVHTLRRQICSLASCNCPADAGVLSTPLQQMSTVFTIFGAFVEGTYISCACLNPSILHFILTISSLSLSPRPPIPPILPLFLLSFLSSPSSSTHPSCLLQPPLSLPTLYLSVPPLLITSP